ncbi:tyrosine-type recombinase/integrase [Streptomyces sp. NPDC052101]|uniref:tyrosine-type recombinase/integrase n=1 Tax=Streptomyces sp. NPDC052101 TaxID=3155763 RepID=UPI003413DDD6
MLQRIGLPSFRLHDLRHCAASLSLTAGLSMKAIQALLGHSSYQLTADAYTSLLPQFEQAAANAPVDLVPRRNGVEKPIDQQADAAEAHSMQLPAPVRDGEEIQQEAATVSISLSPRRQESPSEITPRGFSHPVLPGQN